MSGHSPGCVPLAHAVLSEHEAADGPRHHQIALTRAQPPAAAPAFGSASRGPPAPTPQTLGLPCALSQRNSGRPYAQPASKLSLILLGLSQQMVVPLGFPCRATHVHHSTDPHLSTEGSRQLKVHGECIFLHVQLR